MMMCSSKSKLQKSSSLNERGVLQPNCNISPSYLERRHSSINAQLLISSSSSSTTSTKVDLKSCDDHEKLIPHNSPAAPPRCSKSSTAAAGSIAAARREQVAILQEQRKMRIAHYGRRTTSTITHHHHHHHHLTTTTTTINDDDRDPNTANAEKRCSFITPNSDPVYVVYHDQEWGVPVHDDKLLFELLVLTGAQLGSDWTSVLKKRQDFRDAFSEFDVEMVSKFSEKKMSWISGEYCMELSLVRGVVDNSKRILEIKKEFGSFDKYIWGFVNYKAIMTQYKWCHKIPAKTSKSETISKDMVRRGFRVVGPTVIHSFMQAAGLTNDHLITCPSRHPFIGDS